VNSEPHGTFSDVRGDARQSDALGVFRLLVGGSLIGSVGRVMSQGKHDTTLELDSIYEFKYSLIVHTGHKVNVEKLPTSLSQNRNVRVSGNVVIHIICGALSGWLTRRGMILEQIQVIAVLWWIFSARLTR